MPTGGERTVWGYGDGSTLTSCDTPFGTSAGSSAGRTTCRSPARRCTPAASTSTSRPRGTTATRGSRRCATSPRRAGCYVIGVHRLLRATDVPAELPRRRDLRRRGRLDEPGQVTIVAPGGEVLAGPESGTETISSTPTSTLRKFGVSGRLRCGRSLRPSGRLHADVNTKASDRWCSTAKRPVGPQRLGRTNSPRTGRRDGRRPRRGGREARRAGRDRRPSWRAGRRQA